MDLNLKKYSQLILQCIEMSRNVRFPTMWYVRPAKAQTSLRIRAVWSEPLLVAWIFYDCLATDRTSFWVSKLKRGLHRSSESTLVKMPHCWKSHVAAQMCTFPPQKNGMITVTYPNYVSMSCFYCYVVHIQQMIHVAFPFISSLFDGFIIAIHVSVYVYLLNLAKHLGWKKIKQSKHFKIRKIYSL